MFCSIQQTVNVSGWELQSEDVDMLLAICCECWKLGNKIYFWVSHLVRLQNTRMSEMKVRNVNKLSERTDRNPIIVQFVSTKVNDVCKQIINSKPKIACVNMMTVLQTYFKEDMHSVIQFLPAEGLNPLNIHHEISAMCGNECICRAQVYNWLRCSEQANWACLMLTVLG